ncbi:MFS transporter [Companilactobacillus metriopterae]|uniref:MFS transporter n=1 Tax=Companilactobacillus metriopterae TaxID=1909267 RepID=UPI001F509FEF|nr:MFS transporter [Companilactobacillus metriopterae]
MKNNTSTKWFIISMMLISANLRLPITMMPPLINSIVKDVGMPQSMLGVLTAIPLLTFAAFSPIIVKIAKKLGNELTIFLLFTFLVIGSYVRVIPSTAALLIGTFLVGVGIDSGNVLMPAVIRDRMPLKMNVGTSLYTLSMLLVGAIGTITAGFLISHTSLKITISVLSSISIIALIFWIPNLKHNEIAHTNGDVLKTYKSVWKQNLGWLITFFFGLQSLIYYSIITWIPSLLISHGIPTVTASNLLTILQLTTLPFAFIVPAMAANDNSMKYLNIMLVLGYIFAPLGFLINTSNIPLVLIFVLLTGVGAGIAFNLSIVFFAKKTTNPYQTAEISGMAQSIGFVLAAIGPILSGYVQQRFQTWSAMIILFAIVATILASISFIISHKDNIKE